jgi:periplasmic protein TonB
MTRFLSNFSRTLWIACFGLVVGTATSCGAQTDDVGQWVKQISLRLASQKRFPPGAVGQSGAARVAFTIDRSGNLVSDKLVQSTGFAALDAEAVAMVQRAQPFPPPPAQAGDDKLKFTLPVIFALRSPPIEPSKEDAIIQRQDAAALSKIRGICRGC